MIQNYKVITSNHSTTLVENLVNLLPTELDEVFLKNLAYTFGFEEIMVLNTCNRVAYIGFGDVKIDNDFVLDVLLYINPNFDRKQAIDFISAIEVYEGIEAVQHVMEVAGSIDSMVVGEREIFRQFRSAYDDAVKWNLAGDNLRLLEKKVVDTSKKILTNTRIGEKPMSVASLAMSIILQHLKAERSNHLAFIGAGETNRLLAKLLKPKRIGQYSVFNRSLENAEHLARFLEGEAAALGDLPNSETPFDCLIVCTGSMKPVLTETIWQSMAKNNHTIIVDLSSPSNVDEPLKKTNGITYYSIDNIKELAQINLNHRKNEIILAKRIISKAAEEFPILYQERQIERSLANIPSLMQNIKQRALNEVYQKRISELSEQDQELVFEIADYITKKCISAPIKSAKAHILQTEKK